jgi:hypothetical protein
MHDTMQVSPDQVLDLVQYGQKRGFIAGVTLSVAAALFYKTKVQPSVREKRTNLMQHFTK